MSLLLFLNSVTRWASVGTGFNTKQRKGGGNCVLGWVLGKNIEEKLKKPEYWGVDFNEERLLFLGMTRARKETLWACALFSCADEQSGGVPNLLRLIARKRVGTGRDGLSLAPSSEDPSLNRC